MDETSLGISDMAALTGLSADTLRWYEREGVLPPTPRDANGQRRYGPRERDLVVLLTSLRETGMPTAMMKTFVQYLQEGARSHGRRIGLLEETRALLDEKARAIEAASAALSRKVAHYEELIAVGLDCDGAPVDPKVREMQLQREDGLRPSA